MTNSIFFSIIIPTYNRAHLIQKTIRSVLDQTYDSFEIIVVDDGSTDNTEEMVKSISDKRIYYYKKKNEERAAARNYGIIHSKGEYLTFLDSDDLFYPHHLDEAFRVIYYSSHPEVFHLGYEIKTPEGRVISQINNRKGKLNDQLIYGNSLSCIGVFVRKDIAQANLFNEDRSLTGSEDYELWLRLASRYRIFYSNKITAALIQHENRSVLTFDKEVLIKRIQALMLSLLSDQKFIESYGTKTNIFLAHRYLYLSLHLIMGNFFKDGIKYWLKAVKIHPPVLMSRKTLGIIKNLIKS